MGPIRTTQRRASVLKDTLNKSSSQNLLGWLGRDAQMASVVATAQRYMQIRQAVAALLPAGLAAVVQVVKLDRGQLTLAVPGAAYLTKLRQFAPRLAQALTRQGWQVTEVRVRIQTQTQTQSAGPLADAVQRLLKHHASP